MNHQAMEATKHRKEDTVMEARLIHLFKRFHKLCPYFIQETTITREQNITCTKPTKQNVLQSAEVPRKWNDNS